MAVLRKVAQLTYRRT